MTVDIAFEDAVSTVGDLLKKLQDAWNSIISSVNQVLDLVPFLESTIKPIFDQCEQKVSEVVESITKFYTERGSASALRSVGESWNEQVGKAASNQAGLLVPGSLATNTRWSGPAASMYADSITGQDNALNEIKTITDTLQNVLNQVASAMTNFWVGMAIAVGTYVTLMTGCIIGAATVVGTVPALTAALGFSVTVLGTVTTLSVAFINSFDEKTAALQQLITIDAQFPNNNWPPAVSDTGKSDWTPN